MYVLTDQTVGKPPGTGAVQKYWNRRLPLVASGHCVSFLPVSVPRGRCVGVLGLRIVVQDVAASLRLAVAAAAVRLEFDVAASLMSAVAAATVLHKTVDRIFDFCVLFPGAVLVACLAVALGLGLVAFGVGVCRPWFCPWLCSFSVGSHYQKKFTDPKTVRDPKITLRQASPSKFWDFGSLHQKPRVGGTHGCVRREGSDGWRSPVPRGDNTGRSRPSTSSANHRLPLPPTGPVHRDGSFFLRIVRGASVFWDFGSLLRGPWC